MISAATRAAGRLLRSLVAVIFGAAGAVVGAIVGLLSGFINENGLVQGALVGSISGALVSVEVADSVLRIWFSGECSMDTRLKRTIEALQPHFGRGEPNDIFEPSRPVMVVRRAAVENLPMMKFTKETTEQITCPICLHEFQDGESARRLPACCHVFHLVCIDSWLLWHAQCPMCRHAVY